MRTIIRHPDGVIVNGRLFTRDAYYAADHVSLREFLALSVLVVGLLVWAAVIVGGVVWVIWMVVRGSR